MRPVLLGIVSDIHTGSTVAVCPPEGVKLDDGGKYLPSRPQQWLWQCWTDFWARVAAQRRALKAELWCVYNGDLFEGGAHHGTTQIISGNPEVQAYLAARVFGVPRELRPAHTFIVRGTEAHVGPSGATEEAFARSIHAERDPETDKWSWWHLRLAPHGCLLDFQHHGRQGQRPWTEASVVSLLAAQIFYEHARRGLPHPRLAIRSHRHKVGDSGDSHPVRVIQTPAFQLKTGYAHRVAAESLADIGGVIVTVFPDGQYAVEKVLFTPELPTPWVASA